MRYCPRCGNTTSAAYCPTDGTPTVRQMSASRQGVQVGDVIGGRYRILGELGRGGFGVVLDAIHVTTGHPVAVKILTQVSGSEGQELARRFFQEAATTSRLTHPNTVRVFDFGQTDAGDLFLAMERLTGETLQNMLGRLRDARQALTEVQAVDVAVAVLRSLGEAHALGLVHRDMKPANIFLHQMAGGEAIVKVLDFGIVKTHDATMTQAGKALGTPTHMSPEQAMGQDVDGRSDLYSLGVVLYEALAGSLPFDSENPLTVVMKHVIEEPEPLARRAPGMVRPALAQVVEKALAKKPDERWQSASEMRSALEAAMGTPSATGMYRIPLQVTALVPEPAPTPMGSPSVSPQSAADRQAAALTPAPRPVVPEPEPTPRVLIAAQQPYDDKALQGHTVVQAHAWPAPSPPDEPDYFEIGSELPEAEEEPVQERGAMMSEAPRMDNRREVRLPSMPPTPVPLRPPPQVDPDLHSLLAGSGFAPEVPSFAGLQGMPGLQGLASLQGSASAGLLGALQQMTQAMPRATQPSRRQVEAMWLSPDLKHAIYADPGHRLQLVELGPLGQQPVCVLDLVDGVDFGGHDALIQDVAGTPDGRLVVSASIDGQLRLWDVGGGRMVGELECDAAPTCLAVASDGKLLVVGMADGSVALYELPDLSLRRVLRGHREAVTAVACAGSKRLVVTASEDGMVRTWDPVGGGARLTARVHEGAVASVAVNSSGQMVASGGWDGKVHVWFGRTGEKAAEFALHSDVVAGLAIDKSGNLLCSAGDDRVAKVVHISSGLVKGERHDFRTGVKLARFSEDGSEAVAGAWDGTFRRLSWG